MAIIKNAEMYYARLDPKYPNASFDKTNPTWEVQLRTTNLEQKREWEQLGFKPKLLVGKDGTPEEGEPLLTEDGKKQWRINLKRKSLKRDKDTKEMVPADPVKVVNGHLDDIEPTSIGNGSVGNIRIYQYEYTKADGAQAVASVLMQIQVVKHIVYKAPAREDDFEMTETETIIPEVSEDEDEVVEAAPKKAVKTPSVKTADEHPEDAF